MTTDPQKPVERRKYTQEFKQDAVNRVVRTGKSCSAVSQELGINGAMLARWKRELLHQQDTEISADIEFKPSETAEMLRQARKEIEDLREQRDILKKALGIFSHPSRRNDLS